MLTNIIQLLQLLALFYPVSVSALVQIRKPIALIVPNTGMIRAIVKSINAEKSIITEDMSFADIKSKLKSSAVAPIVYISRNTDIMPQKVEKQWRLVFNAVILSEVDVEAVSTQILFLYEKHIPERHVDDFFKIFINEEESAQKYLGIDVSKYESACLDKSLIERICEANRKYSPEQCAFFSVVDFATEFDEDIDAEELKKTAKLLITYDDEVEDVGDVLSMFRDSMYGLAENAKFSDVFSLPNLETEEIKRLDEIMLYDETFVIMTNKMFNKVIRDIRELFPIDVIKRTLVEKGVLIGGKDRFAVKIQYINPYGETVRPCMLKFEREKINKVGEMDFVDLCINNTEDNNNDY